MKLYYDQHAKDHPFRVGLKVWLYNPLGYDTFWLIKQITLVSFKIANLQGKLQKGSI